MDKQLSKTSATNTHTMIVNQPSIHRTQNEEKHLESDEKAEPPKSDVYEGNFNALDLIAITGSYLGCDCRFNAIKSIVLTNTANIDPIPVIHKSAEYINKFNEYQSKKYSKLRKALTKKSNKASEQSAANIWDRQYCSVCVARDISYSSIQNYAFPKLKTQKNGKNGDILVKCGGIYAMNPMKTSALCDGYVLNEDDCLMKCFQLPSLKCPRSNGSVIFDKSLGFIIYGGRSHKKALLNDFEVLNAEKNESEWNSKLIPSTKEYRSRHPSLGIYDRTLFVCGGRGVAAFDSAECLRLDGDGAKWQSIASMNYSRSFASNLLNWRAYESMIVMGGYGSIFSDFYAEQYDLNKNKWFELPKCHYSHKYHPVIKLTANESDGHQQLLVVVGDKRTKGNLGKIEILDIRMKKWMKCKISADELLQLDKKQELRRLLFF